MHTKAYLILRLHENDNCAEHGTVRHGTVNTLHAINWS